VLDGRIRRLAKQAGEQLVQVGRLLDQAQAGRVHETLGFPGWTAYVADALGGELQLSGEARQAMVQLMAGEGMSVRAIASATGASKSTVARDIGEVSHNGTPEPELDVSHDGTPDDNRASEPATVTGLDGKTYTKPKPKPKDSGGKRTVQRRRRTARRTVEKMAIDLNGWAVALGIDDGVDPSELEVDQQLQDEITTIRDSMSAIRDFVDQIKPSRQPQIRTIYRAKVAEMNQLVRVLELLTLDPRWPKAVAGFTDKDLDSLDLVMTALRQRADHLVAVKISGGQLQTNAPTPPE
jgi:hypothetical protein